jgi:hypothetical protein
LLPEGSLLVKVFSRPVTLEICHRLFPEGNRYGKNPGFPDEQLEIYDRLLSGGLSLGVFIVFLMSDGNHSEA